jgi:hypothetical protein
VIYRRLLNRSVFPSMVLALFLILSSCSSWNVGGSLSQDKGSTSPGAGTSSQNCPQAPCITGTGGTTTKWVPGVRPLINTWNNIHPFQNFDFAITDLSGTAKRYDAIWGAEWDHVKAYRASNPDIFLSYYIPFHRDWGTWPGFSTRHDLAYWKATHPDWVLYKCDRVTPALEFGDPNIALDFSNPAFISWQIQTYAVPASAGGYDGLAPDNVNLVNLYGACGIYKNGQWVQLYTGQPDDPKWNADVINWLKVMQQAVHHLKRPMALIPNFYAGHLSLTSPEVQQALKYSDGILDEEGFTDQGRDYQTDDNWVQKVHFMEEVQQQNKPFYSINQFPSVGRNEIQWALASYLMGKGSSAMVFITSIQGYGEEHLHDEYKAQIGSPVQPMQQAQGVYYRSYTRGMVAVNPSSTQTSVVNLDGGPYHDLYGNAVGASITLSPHSGIVLLRNS